MQDRPPNGDKIEIVVTEGAHMGNVMEFSQRRVKPEPQFDLAVQIAAIQVSQQETAAKFSASMEAFGRNLRDIDELACCIDDAEAREQVRLRSKSIRREVLLALWKWLDACRLDGDDFEKNRQ
jgi:hypothetical protein